MHGYDAIKYEETTMQLRTTKCANTQVDGSGRWRKQHTGFTVTCLILLLTACKPPDAGNATASSTTPATLAAPTIPAPTPEQAAARLQECRTRLQAAMSLNLVTNASFDNGRPILWVGTAWEASSLHEKEALAREAACFFLSGDESKTIRFSIYDNARDREVAVWNLSHLVMI